MMAIDYDHSAVAFDHFYRVASIALRAHTVGNIIHKPA
jgi:hypothetical protein